MRTRRRAGATVAAVTVAALLAAGCGAPDPSPPTRVQSHSVGHPSAGSAEPGHGSKPAPTAPTASAAPARPVALRAGESLRTVTSPVSYTPKVPTTGTDDYHCFVLDPDLARDAYVTGFDITPGRPSQVHHVILFRVPRSAAAAARARDAESRGGGWTCFGGTGLGSRGGSLDDAPWVGGWAPGGGENVLPADVGIPLERGSLLVMQVHYNLRNGSEPDRTSVELRLSSSSKLKSLETMLYPAPVELPCRTGRSGPP